ncbi:hypothetical protein Patl1_26473 [Pistacia atlantica]|uniref:Uncharacterized protein n=1 Tax=Pistacia atlantica TaxID=434234 RepID=A0ACC1B4Q1_9ROSI|nr:hypothetical protein Patl1_26473 [Pistacia atlantica]
MQVELDQKVNILHEDITKHIPEVIPDTQDPEPAHEDSKIEEEHDIIQTAAFLKTAPPSEPLTSIFESDQEVATVDEETADEPAMAFAPGLAPISSTFQDQDSAASVQPTTPPLTMISPLLDNSAESHCSIFANFSTRYFQPQPSVQASARSLARSVPSTHLESEVIHFLSCLDQEICFHFYMHSFSTTGDARIIFAKHENMLDDSLEALPGCSQQPTVSSHEISVAQEFIRRCCLMGFEHLSVKIKGISFLHLLMSIDNFNFNRK